MAKLNGTIPPDRNLERTYRKKDGTTIVVLCQDDSFWMVRERFRAFGAPSRTSPSVSEMADEFTQETGSSSIPSWTMLRC